MISFKFKLNWFQVKKPTNNVEEFQKAIEEANKIHNRLVNGERVSLDEVKVVDGRTAVTNKEATLSL